MRVNSLEIEVFELTPAVAVTMGRRNYEDEEEGPEEEEPEEEEPEESDEEDEPEEMLWRSSTTFDYDGTVRTMVKGEPSAAVRQLRDASDSVSGEVAKAISLACHIVRNNPEQLGLQLYARLLNSSPPRAIAKVIQKTKENQTSPWPGPLCASLPCPGRGEI
jgi:hypothetical protein